MISSTLSLLKTQSGLSLWEEQKPSINQVLLLKESCPPLFLNWNAAPPGTSPPPGPSRRWKLPVTALYNIRSFLPIFPEGWGGSSEAQAAQPWSPRLSSVNLVPGLAQLLSHLRTPNACSQSDDPSSVHFCPFPAGPLLVTWPHDSLALPQRVPAFHPQPPLGLNEATLAARSAEGLFPWPRRKPGPAQRRAPSPPVCRGSPVYSPSYWIRLESSSRIPSWIQASALFIPASWTVLKRN